MRKFTRYLNSQVCPWWFCPAFDNPLRHLVQNPDRLLRDLIQPGQSVLDLGCGMGYFTPALARLAGPTGHVYAVDLQPQMLAANRQRVMRMGAADWVHFQQCQPGKLGLSQPLDFALVFWMLHEVPDKAGLLAQVGALLKPGASLLLAEPYLHVSQADFEQALSAAADCGLQPSQEIPVFFSRAMLLKMAGSQ